MSEYLPWMVMGFGTIALIGVFSRMKPGFGPFTLRAVGIVVVATFAALLALQGTTALTGAMGILGAIAGYLFGIKDPKA